MIRAIVSGVVGVALGVSLYFFCVQTSSCEEDVYAKIVPVGGIVTRTKTANGDLERVPNKIIIFRRTDCKRCISSVITDNEGKYAAYLSNGRYEIIVGDCGPNKNQDCIAPNQIRLIDLIPKGNSQFDLQLLSGEDDRKIQPPTL